MAELADALDSKSSAGHPAWGFKSPLRHPDLPKIASLHSFLAKKEEIRYKVLAAFAVLELSFVIQVRLVL